MSDTRSRHLISLGGVPSQVIDAVANRWRADKVNQGLSSGVSVLFLLEHQGGTPRGFVETLSSLDRSGSTVGVIPVCEDSWQRGDVNRMLAGDPIDINFATSRFRLCGNVEVNVEAAPPALRRALNDDFAAVADDLNSVQRQMKCAA